MPLFQQGDKPVLLSQPEFHLISEQEFSYILHSISQQTIKGVNLTTEEFSPV